MTASLKSLQGNRRQNSDILYHPMNVIIEMGMSIWGTPGPQEIPYFKRNYYGTRFFLVFFLKLHLFSAILI